MSNNKEWQSSFEELKYQDTSFEKHSWEVLNSNIVIKKTDRSFFLHRGSGLPIDLRSFFNVCDLEHGSGRYITLIYDGKEYQGRISRESFRMGRTRLSWTEKLSERFNSAYLYSEVDLDTNPFLLFEKKSNGVYKIFFVDSKNDDMIISRSSENYSLITKIEINDVEGKKVVYYTTKYERSQKNRNAAISYHGAKCMVCGFDFEETYGEIGKDFIEVHHVKPLCSLDEEVVICPETDLACVCPNCHRMIHRPQNKILSIDELRTIVNSRSN